MRETRLNQLEQAVEELKDELAGVKDELAEEREARREAEQRVEELEEWKEDHDRKHDALQNWLDAIEDTNEEQEQHVEETEQRVSQLENVFTLEQPGPSLEGEDEDDSETSLEQVVSWPDSAAEDELTSNQQHAREIASNLGEWLIKDGHKKYQLRSREVRKALVARTGEKPHSETVRRVMDALGSLGGELTTEDTVKRGERRIWWTDEAPTRLRDARSRGDVIGASENRAVEA